MTKYPPQNTIILISSLLRKAQKTTNTMKFTISSLILFSFIMFMSSCSKEEQPVDIQCDDTALFEINNATGTMRYLPCYDSWAIHTADPTNADSRILAASLSIPEEFKSEDLTVTFSACFYTFDLPLILPDPAPWDQLYVITNFSISKD